MTHSCYNAFYISDIDTNSLEVANTILIVWSNFLSGRM